MDLVALDIENIRGILISQCQLPTFLYKRFFLLSFFIKIVPEIWFVRFFFSSVVVLTGVAVFSKCSPTYLMTACFASFVKKTPLNLGSRNVEKRENFLDSTSLEKSWTCFFSFAAKEEALASKNFVNIFTMGITFKILVYFSLEISLVTAKKRL